MKAPKIGDVPEQKAIRPRDLAVVRQESARGGEDWEKTSMKTRAQKILALAVLPLGLLASACRAEAEEGRAAQPENSPAAGVEEPAKSGAEPEEAVSEELDAEVAESGEGDTNVVINQEITVLKELPPTSPPELDLSEGVEAIVKLAQSGVSEAVILTFIETTDHAYDLDAAGILYLNDIGISPTILAAMLNHDGAPDELKALAAEGETALAETAEPPVEQAEPGPISRSILTGDFGAAQSAGMVAEAPVEVTTNYVAAETQVVQQPVVVEQPVVVQQPVVYTQPEVTHSYFYSSLAPYGSWIFVADYGWCWQPTVAVSYSGWRPYTHGGNWLYTDAGWYWKSHYSWGWAPFHYGRWFCPPGRGWVWVPDYTWGPSWVTWRRNPYYAGWAPLPPRAHYHSGIGFSYFGRRVGVGFHFGLGHEHFSFVRTRDFCDPRLVHHVLPTGRTVNIYNNSTIVNNYVVGNNNTIINRGIDREVVERHVRREIPKIGIRDLPTQPGRRVPAERITKSGTELVMYRPKPPSPTVAATATKLRSEQLKRVRESDLVRPVARPGEPQRPGAAVEPGRALAGTTRSEVSRGREAGTATSGRAISPRLAAREEPGRAPGQTWAKPAPFVRPAPEPAAPTRSLTRSRAEVSRGVPSTSAGSRVGGGLVATRPSRLTAEPTRSITPVSPSSSIPVDIPGARLRQPVARPESPAVTRNESVTGRQSPWSSRSSASRWSSRPEAITRTPSGSTVPQRSVTPVAPSGRSRLDVTRPSTPSLGSSRVPGANVGGRIETTRPSTPSVPSRSITPTIPSRTVTPSVPQRSLNSSPSVVQPRSSVQPSRPVTIPSAQAGPWSRRESIARPSVPQPTGRQASPIYQSQQPRVVTPVPSGRAASPVYQTRPAAPVRSAPAVRTPTVTPRAAAPVRSAPAVRAPAPAVRAPAPTVRSAPAPSPAAPRSAPATSGRGRMEIRR